MVWIFEQNAKRKIAKNIQTIVNETTCEADEGIHRDGSETIPGRRSE